MEIKARESFPQVSPAYPAHHRAKGAQTGIIKKAAGKRRQLHISIPKHRN
jgi:hypothetical protein